MIELADEITSLIWELHDSDITGELSWFYDGVWRAGLSASSRGIKAEAIFDSMSHAAEWLRTKAVELYPDSEFAKVFRYRN